MAWLDAPAWVLSKREVVMWSREREQRNEVRERADTIRRRNEETEGRKRR